jgi:peroxiredoxin
MRVVGTTPKLGEVLPRAFADAVVTDARGAEVALSSFWEGGPCLLVLLRHFGCVGCAEQVTELAPRLDELARAGVRVVLVGNGTKEQLVAFMARQALVGAAVDVVTDPSLRAYEALGLVRSAWATVGPRALYQLARAMGAGFPHRLVEGDPTQQGGAILVDERGVVRFIHRNRSLGDHASASDLVEAALRLAIEQRSGAALV